MRIDDVMCFGHTLGQPLYSGARVHGGRHRPKGERAWHSNQTKRGIARRKAAHRLRFARLRALAAEEESDA